MSWFRRSRNADQPQLVQVFADLEKFSFAEFVPESEVGRTDRVQLRYAMSNNDLSTMHLERINTLKNFKGELLNSYSERAFLLNTYLPRVRGEVLDVGVNKPNERDCEALPDPALHHTIDTDPLVSAYGSPTHHRNLDFFDLPLGEKYTHLLMFGLLGTPNNRSSSDAHITVDKNDEMIVHADNFVVKGGEILLGPELDGSSRTAADKDVREWIHWIQENETLKNNYDLIYAMRGRCNLIAVFGKHS